MTRRRNPQPFGRLASGGRSLRSALAGLVALFVLGPSWTQPATLAAQDAPSAVVERAAPVFPAADWERIAEPEEVGYSRELLDSVVAYTSTLHTTGLVVAVGGRILLE